VSEGPALTFGRVSNWPESEELREAWRNGWDAAQYKSTHLLQ
jgi:hypothetical protein